MKKTFIIAAVFILAAAIVWTACEKDEDPPKDETNEIVFNEPTVDSISYRIAKIKISSENTSKANIESAGVCWGIKENPTADSNKMALEEGFSGNLVITGLQPNTTYHYRTYAKTENWAAYGEDKTFSTNPFGTPVISTANATNITAVAAISGGEVSEINGSEVSQCGVCWNKTGDPAISDNKTIDSLNSGGFESRIEGLEIGIQYHLKAYATNEAGTAYGQEITFATKDGTIELTTNEVTDITYNSATCGGNITDSGGMVVAERGLCWSTSAEPTIDDDFFNEGSGLGSFTHTIEGLEFGKTYYIRAYAMNALPGETNRGKTKNEKAISRNASSKLAQSNTARKSYKNRERTKHKPTRKLKMPSTKEIFYGEQKTFATNGLPAVTTEPATNITSSSATTGGEVTSDGGEDVTARGVCWGASPNPTLSDNYTTDGSGTGSFTSNIDELEPGVNYYVRAYATNAAGTTYGNQIGFVTLPVLPTVTTTEITSITSSTAQSGGEVTSSGGGTVIARGVCWSASAGPTIDDSHTTDGAGMGAFTSTITGLDPGTTYYVRAYATNSEGKTTYSKLSSVTKEAGTGYGSELSFATLVVLPSVTTAPVTGITATTATSGGEVTNNGGGTVSARGVCWSTSPNPTLSDDHTTDGTGTGTFTSDITGLSYATTYYVRAYATNEAGTEYGQEVTFTTYSPPPVADFTADNTTIDEGITVNFTDLSSNSPTAWSWDFGDGGTSTVQNPSHVYNTEGTYTVSLTVTNSYGSDTETKTNYITVESFGTDIVEVTNPTTGKTWMDRNLGASQAATSSTDAQAYGDLYQWGRDSDGHQIRTSGTTSTLSSSDNPGHGDFILAPDSPYDWRSPQNDNLWQGASGTNNPCPTGYRLPTEAEWQAELDTWSSNNAAGAYASPLKLPVAGSRNFSSGSLSYVGSYGYYWSSTVDGSHSRFLFFFSSVANMNSSDRAHGISVRCLKD